MALPKVLDETSFAFRDLTSQDLWTQFSPVFGSLTVVGTPNYSGRFRVVGKKIEVQVRFSASTSIASTAGVDYLTLPVAKAGLAGMGVMTDQTTKIAVGVCHIDSARAYLPSQAASADVFNLAIWYEI